MDQHTRDGKRARIDPAIWIGLFALVCGIAGAVLLDGPFRGTGMFIVCTLVTLVVSALAYTVLACALGWRRINGGKLLDWLQTVS